ncbi:MAG: hypothetical protein QM675_07245 [Protaetiibacter sp.]
MSAPDVNALPAEPPAAAEPPQAKAERSTAAERIVELAVARYRLGVTLEGEHFAARKERPHIALPLRGGRLGLRHALAHDYREATGKVAGQQALADALLTLAGIAQESPPEVLHLRVAETPAGLFVDTGDTAGTVLHVTPGEWSVRDSAPVMFTRTELTGVLAAPARGGDIARLFEFLNVAAEDHPILLAWLVAALLPDLPHPILTLTGEQGTGKSTAARMLVELVDPSPVALRKPPRDADGLVTGFSGSWVVALDNLSTVNDWLSDSLCRIVTGEGDVRRQLYTDGGLSVFAFRRAVILTGIDFAGLRGDLAERMSLVQLHRIPDTQRADERGLQEHWQQALPGLRGALLDLAADVLRVLPAVKLASKPRMADFARIVAAVDRLRGSDGLSRYSSQAAEIAADSLAASPFVERLLTLSLDFTGTAAQLLEQVTPRGSDWKAPRLWPKGAREVTTLLKRDAPALRQQGWRVDDVGEDRTHSRLWLVVSPDLEVSSRVLFEDPLADEETF